MNPLLTGWSRAWPQRALDGAAGGSLHGSCPIHVRAHRPSCRQMPCSQHQDHIPPHRASFSTTAVAASLSPCTAPAPVTSAQLVARANARGSGSKAAKAAMAPPSPLAANRSQSPAGCFIGPSRNWQRASKGEIRFIQPAAALDELAQAEHG